MSTSRRKFLQGALATVAGSLGLAMLPWQAQGALVRAPSYAGQEVCWGTEPGWLSGPSYIVFSVPSSHTAGHVFFCRKPTGEKGWTTAQQLYSEPQAEPVIRELGMMDFDEWAILHYEGYMTPGPFTKADLIPFYERPGYRIG